MLTAALILILILPILCLCDKIKMKQREQSINEIKKGRKCAGKANPELEKKIYDELDAELAPYLDIVDPKANVGLVVKQLRDKYEPGVNHQIYPEIPGNLPRQRKDNYDAVLWYSCHKHNIKYSSRLSIDLKHNVNKETAMTNLKRDKYVPFPEQYEITFENMEAKHDWFMKKYNEITLDYCASLYGERRLVHNCEPVLFFKGEELYQVVPKNRAEAVSGVKVPMKILLDCPYNPSKEEFEQFLIDNPEIWCKIKKVSEYFDDCPPLPPILPPRIVRTQRTLSERVCDAGGEISKELIRLYDSTARAKLVRLGVTQLTLTNTPRLSDYYGVN